MTDIFIHPNALCESEAVGAGTRIWAFAHVMRDARIGALCNIGDHAFIESGVVIGDRVTVKNRSMIFEGAVIADDVFIGPGVIFTNDSYPRSPRMAGAPGVEKRYANKANWLRGARVGRGASLGAGAVILPGIEIGEFALVAAGAVVTRNVPAHALVSGNPARRTGWVCACGKKLNPVTEGFHCSDCDRIFKSPLCV